MIYLTNITHIMPLCARRTPGMSGYGCVAAGVAFVARRAGDVRRTPVCRRRLTLVRLKPWAAAGEAAVTFGGSGDQIGDVALIEEVTQSAMDASRLVSGHTQG